LIEPRPAVLLRLAGDALESQAGNPKQLRAAVWLLRDLAKTIDARDAAIAKDIADMRAMLPDADIGTLDAAQAHVALQQRLEALAQDRGMHRKLRALHLAMLERERALLGPPGGNPSLEAPQ